MSDDTIQRLLDANANRAREGLRVAEDVARFILDDGGLTEWFKTLRHRVTAGLEGWISAGRLEQSRESESDVGRPIQGAGEYDRLDVLALVRGNLARAQEALRVMEEFAKLDDVRIACHYEALRYDTYTAEKRLVETLLARKPRVDARLCLITDSRLLRGRPMSEVVEAAIRGGADMIQVREKDMEDCEVIALARSLMAVTARYNVPLIVNDRPDIAAVVKAEGVHLGQEDMEIADARRIVGLGVIIGRSTHSIDEALKAQKEGADYIGVGPVFATSTKDVKPVGPGYVREVARAVELPGFAIGGITSENIAQVLGAGGRHVAVASAILGADDPEEAARELRGAIDAAVFNPAGGDRANGNSQEL